MWWLHVLAAVSALVFGGTFFSQPGPVPIPGWQVALAFVGGALVPYFVAFSWAFLVAPPDLRQIFRHRGAAENRRNSEVERETRSE